MPHAEWPRSAVARALPLRQATAEPFLHRRHSDTQRQVWFSLCGVSGSWCTQGFAWALQASLTGMWFDSKCDFTPCTILLGSPFALGYGVSFLVQCNILLLMVVQQQFVIFELSQEKMSSQPCSLPSCRDYTLYVISISRFYFFNIVTPTVIKSHN